MNKTTKHLILLLFSFSAVMACKKDDPEPENTSVKMQYIQADDVNIQYSGRIDFTDPQKPAFTYPGVSIKTNFKGTAVDLVMDDFSGGGTTTTNYYNIILDDGAKTKVLEVNNADTLYKLFRNLSNGEHTIEVIKRTESSVGKSAFMGFRIEKGKTLLPPPTQPVRKLEFIGNSITCGYGNEASIAAPPAGNPTTGFNSANEDNYQAWGAITSRNLDAQYMCVAYSGRGMYRNNTGSTTGTLPLIYDRIFPDDGASPTWNFANYTPDVVVINLGTNDFAPEGWGTPDPVDSAAFVSTYINFVSTVRGNYPSAKIVCVTGNMMSDFWPVGFNAWTRIQSFVQEVVDQQNGGGDNEVYYFSLTPQSAPYGEDWHPTAATHTQMATALTTYIQSITGW